jgi:hypothetical protein
MPQPDTRHNLQDLTRGNTQHRAIQTAETPVLVSTFSTYLVRTDRTAEQRTRDTDRRKKIKVSQNDKQDDKQEGMHAVCCLMLSAAGCFRGVFDTLFTMFRNAEVL